MIGLNKFCPRSKGVVARNAFKLKYNEPHNFSYLLWFKLHL